MTAPESTIETSALLPKADKERVLFDHLVGLRNESNAGPLRIFGIQNLIISVLVSVDLDDNEGALRKVYAVEKSA